MTKEDTAVYREALAKARAQFDSASKRLEAAQLEAIELTKDISRLKRTITALAAMCSESPGFDHLGITDACMEVMEAQKTLATTTDVVRALESIGFELSGQKNASASVHAVLGRLAAKGKIAKVVEQDGNLVRWQGPNYDPTAISDDDIPF